MKLFTLITTLSLLSSAICLRAEEDQAPKAEMAEHIVWMTDFEQAKAIAKEESKPLFLYFTGSDWCPWCKRMDNEILSKNEFYEALGTKMIFVKIDFPKRSALDPNIQKQNEMLKTAFEIRGFPTVIILDSEGKKIGVTGYKQGGPLAFANSVERMLEAYATQ